ncbi:MAG: HD domain-containing protein [Candidatus Berkelbacteria bacterium]
MAQFLALLGDLPISTENEELVIRMFMACGLWGPGGWPNTAVHCAKVAQVAMELCKLAELPISAVENVVFAGLVHDARKSFEKAQIAQLTSGGMSKDDAYTAAACTQATWLIEFGIPDHIVGLSGLSGHTSLGGFYPELPDSLPAMAFHVADDLCGGQYGDELVMLHDRMAQLRERYDWLSNTREELGGRSWIDVQAEVADQIMDAFATQTVFQTGEALNRWLVRYFN